SWKSGRSSPACNTPISPASWTAAPWMIDRISSWSISRGCRSTGTARIGSFPPASGSAYFPAVGPPVPSATQNLVLHRDLKPGNILIDDTGAPKLVDFGIAKVLNPQWSQPGRHTRTCHPLTPEYASPEQIRGDALPNTTSDVYALGVVLYELL